MKMFSEDVFEDRYDDTEELLNNKNQLVFILARNRSVVKNIYNVAKFVKVRRRRF